MNLPTDSLFIIATTLLMCAVDYNWRKDPANLQHGLRSAHFTSKEYLYIIFDFCSPKLSQSPHVFRAKVDQLACWSLSHCVTPGRLSLTTEELFIRVESCIHTCCWSSQSNSISTKCADFCETEILNPMMTYIQMNFFRCTQQPCWLIFKICRMRLKAFYTHVGGWS